MRQKKTPQLREPSYHSYMDSPSVQYITNSVPIQDILML